MADDDVLYAIADTHLGLRERGGKQSRDDPVTVAGFLRWLGHLPSGGVTIPVLEPSGVKERTLRPPTHLVLLGDILELWDSENATLLLSAASVLPALSAFPARIVYVLGNHDNILAISEGSYPIAKGSTELMPETFPHPEPDGSVRPMPIGERAYVLVHGHQLDRFFLASRGSWKWLGHLRQIGAAMGSYAWVFSALALLTGISLLAITPIVAVWLILAALVLLVIPRGFMTVARPLYDLRGLRYRRDAARKGFRKWWSRFQASVASKEGLAIVYGHTHVLDHFEENEDGTRISTGSRPGGIGAYNISSWVSVKGGYETVTRATFLYADAAGPLLLGWDWVAQRPFHIPDAFAEIRGDRRLSAAEAETASRLGWPPKLVAKWTGTDEKVRTLFPFRARHGRRQETTRT